MSGVDATETDRIVRAARELAAAAPPMRPDQLERIADSFGLAVVAQERDTKARNGDAA